MGNTHQKGSLASGGEVPFQEFWVEWNTSLLNLILGSLWPGVVVQVKVSSKGQIDLFENYLYQTGIFDI